MTRLNYQEANVYWFVLVFVCLDSPINSQLTGWQLPSIGSYIRLFGVFRDQWIFQTKRIKLAVMSNGFTMKFINAIVILLAGKIKCMAQTILASSKE